MSMGKVDRVVAVGGRLCKDMGTVTTWLRNDMSTMSRRLGKHVRCRLGNDVGCMAARLGKHVCDRLRNYVGRVSARLGDDMRRVSTRLGYGVGCNCRASVR